MITHDQKQHMYGTGREQLRTYCGLQIYRIDRSSGQKANSCPSIVLVTLAAQEERDKPAERPTCPECAKGFDSRKAKIAAGEKKLAEYRARQS